MGKIISVFWVISLLLAGLGLFGMTALASARRTREIGIRKAIGATPIQIVRLLSTQVVQLIAFGIAIAWPLPYWFMSSWLEQFEYRTDLTLSTFVVGAAAAFTIGLLTVSYHSLKSAFADPTVSLRQE